MKSSPSRFAVIPTFLFLLCVFMPLAAAEDLSAWRAELPAATAHDRAATHAFMDRNLNYVRDVHTELDPADPQYGMIYEFWVPSSGRWYQDKGLDTMHDMAWTGYGLTLAYRATGDADYWAFLRDQVLPFYTNMMNNSGTLFGSGVDGHAVYWWDDGDSYDIPTDQPLNGHRQPPKYYSNHMAQDIGPFLGHAWLLNRDPAIASAVMGMWNERKDDVLQMGIGPLPIGAAPWVPIAAGVTNEDQALIDSVPVQSFSPDVSAPYDSLYGLGSSGPVMDAYNDWLEWTYQNLSMQQWPVSLEEPYTQMIAHAIYCRQIFVQIQQQDLFEWGQYNFDLTGTQIPISNGKPDVYFPEQAAASQNFWVGTRGIQFSVMGAFALQLLERYPDAYSLEYRTYHNGKPIVEFTHDPPILDGTADADYSDPLTFGSTQVQLVSDVKNLYLLMDAPSTGGSVRVYATDSASGYYGEFSIDGSGNLTAKNNSNQDIMVDAVVSNQGGRWIAEIQALYTHSNRDQAAWCNGIEHKPYRLTGGGDSVSIFMMTPQEKVKQYLEQMINGTIDTWESVFDTLGYLPSGHYKNNLPLGSWTGRSDSGAYAHLIAMCSQYINYLNGTSDWAQVWTVQAGNVTVALDTYHNSEDSQPLHYHWDGTYAGGFSELGSDIESLGAELTTIGTEPTAEALSGANILIIVDPDTASETSSPNFITSQEADAIEAWVNNGGALVLMGNDAGNAEFTNFNALAGRFGITFNQDSTGGTIGPLPAHPFFNNADELYIVGMSTLSLSAPAESVLTSGSDVLMATSEAGDGIVVAIGDPWLYNEYIDTEENRIAGKNVFGQLIDRFAGQDTTPPGVPGDFEAVEVTDTTVRLDWTESGDNRGVAGYHVYKDDSMIATVSDTQYTAECLTPDTAYAFTVSAFDAAENESPQSNAANITTATLGDFNYNYFVEDADLQTLGVNWLLAESCALGDYNQDGVVDAADFAWFAGAWTGPDTEAPSVPQNLVTVNITDVSIAFAWDASTDNGPEIDYNVFRDSILINTVGVTEYTDAGLDPCSVHSYQVSAVDGFGNESALSDPLEAETLSAANLLEDANPGFEFADSGNPTDWINRSASSQDTTVSHTGNASLKGIPEDGDEYMFNTKYKDQTLIALLAPSTTYEIAGWMKGDGVTGLGLEVRVWIEDIGVIATPWQSGTFDWTFESATFTTPADMSGINNGRFEPHWVMTTGTAWFDDVSLRVSE